MHPAFGAVHVADFAPGVEFLNDFDRHTGHGVVPGDIVFGTWPDPDIDRVGSRRDEAGQFKSRNRFGLGKGHGRVDENARQDQRQNGKNTEEKATGTARSGVRYEHDFADGLELPYQYAMILNGP